MFKRFTKSMWQKSDQTSPNGREKTPKIDESTEKFDQNLYYLNRIYNYIKELNYWYLIVLYFNNIQKKNQIIKYGHDFPYILLKIKQ